MCVLCEAFHAQAAGSPACIDGYRAALAPADAAPPLEGMGYDPYATERVLTSNSPRIDGVIYGEKWAPAEITYSDPNQRSDYERHYDADMDVNGVDAPRQGLTRLSAAQLRVAQSVLDTAELGQPAGYDGFSAEGFTRLELSYVPGASGAARIRIANTRDAPAPHDTAYAHWPAPWAEGGDVWFEASGDDPVAGNYDFMTVIHEIGHALGLKHPHETWGFPEMPIGADAIEFTVMSYRTYIGDGLDGYDAEQWGFPQTYMMLDIAALQHMYGADFGTRSGNTSYAWDPETGTTTVGGEVAIAPGGNRVFLTVWDGGGVDRYDFSAYKTGVDADLAPGGHSVLSTKQLADLGGGPNGGHAHGNVYNPLQYQGDPRSLIENATGGAGSDVIRGNAAANRLAGHGGHDELFGRSGEDRLRGGPGADRLDGGHSADLLLGGRGADVLIGGLGEDVFHFSRVEHSPSGAGRDVIAASGGAAFDGASWGPGDRIDLSDIDANAIRPGSQSFVLGGEGRGHLEVREREAGSLVCGNIDRDKAFEFVLLIEDGAAVAARAYCPDDFIL